MSYFRRGYNWETTHYIPAPQGGWNMDANPWDLPAEQAQILDNFLIRSGKLVMRGPVADWSDLTGSATPFNYAGGFVAPGGAAVVTSKGSANYADPWNCVLTPLPANDAPATSTFVTKTGTASVVADLLAPGPRYINFNGFTYYITYGWSATNSDAAGSYVAPRTNLAVSTIAAGNTYIAPTFYPGAPAGSFDLKEYQSRVWLLGGVDTPSGGTTHSATTLFYTTETAGGLGNASDWFSPRTGLSNKIVLDNNSQDFGVGLAVTRAGLLILRHRSLWLLRGTTESNYTVMPISKEVGCVDARSIVETDRGVFFMSHRGLMLTDGVRVSDESGAAKNLLQMLVSHAQLTIQGNGASGTSAISTGLLRDGQILVTIVKQDASVDFTKMAPLFTGVYNPALRSWTRMTSWMFQRDTRNVKGYPGMLLTTSDSSRLYTVGDRFVTSIEDLSGPHQTSMTSPELSQMSFADVSASGVGYQIQPVWVTHIAPIVGTSSLTRKMAQAKRFFVDYAFDIEGHTDVGWGVQPFNADPAAANVGSPLIVPLGGGSSAGGLFVQNLPIGNTAVPVIQRSNQDMFQEVSDLQFRVTWSPSGTYPQAVQQIAEIYGIGVEFQPGRDLR